MWISKTYDKFHPGFPVKTSLPGLDFPVNLPKYSVDFQDHSLGKNMSSTGGGEGDIDIFCTSPMYFSFL